MATYIYQCEGCGRKIEIMTTMDKRDEYLKNECLSCGGEFKRVYTTPTLTGFDNLGRSINKKTK